MLEKQLRVRNMKGIGIGIALIISGLALFITGLSWDVAPNGEVLNIGELQKQMIFIHSGLAAIFLGGFIIAIGQLRNQLDPELQTERPPKIGVRDNNSTVAPDDDSLSIDRFDKKTQRDLRRVGASVGYATRRLRQVGYEVHSSGVLDRKYKVVSPGGEVKDKLTAFSFCGFAQDILIKLADKD